MFIFFIYYIFLVRLFIEQNTIAVSALRRILPHLAFHNTDTILPLAETCSSLYRAAKQGRIWKNAFVSRFPHNSVPSIESQEYFIS